jgi:hypothetical protein
MADNDNNLFEENGKTPNQDRNERSEVRMLSGM